jgi:hypothetical protein
MGARVDLLVAVALEEVVPIWFQVLVAVLKGGAGEGWWEEGKVCSFR